MIEEIEYNERNSFEQWMKDAKLSDRTRKEYLYYYDKLGDSSKIQDQIFVDNYVRRHKSIARAALKNLIEYILDNSHLYSKEITNCLRDIRFTKERGRVPRKIPKIIPKEALERLYDVMDVRGKIMLSLTVNCGLRASELININIEEDFNWTEWKEDTTKFGKLTILGKGGKQRILFVKPELMGRVKYFWNEIMLPKYSKSKVEFNNLKERNFHCGLDRWEKIFKRATENAKLEEVFKLKGVSVHSLRHTFATNMLNKGFKIQEVRDLLGHSSVTTTEIYLHLVQKDVKEKYEKFYSEGKLDIL